MATTYPYGIDQVWIGQNYREHRTLVLGESWYGDYADNTDKGYVRLYLDGEIRDRMYTRMANAVGLDRQDFWNRILFTNFVGRVGDHRTDRPTNADFRAAIPRLRDLVAEYKPIRAWVLGIGQGEFSGPVLNQLGLKTVVSPHPTAYGIRNAKLGADWQLLMSGAEDSVRGRG